MENCPFCQIIPKDDEKQIQKEEESWAVIDSKPKMSGFHKLIISKEHTQELKFPNEIIKDIIMENNLKHFKLMCNIGDFAEIKHLHWHILA